MNYSPVCFQSTLLVLVSVSTVIAMFLKTLTFAILAVGVLAKYEPTDAQRDQLKALLTQYCRKNGAEEKAEEVMTAVTTFGDCLKAQINLDTLKQEIEEAKPKGMLDEVFGKYCAKTPQIKECIHTMSAAAVPCIDASVRDQVGTFNNATDQLLDFVCYKDGDRIALFIAEGGPECFADKANQIRECGDKLKEGVTSLDDAKKLSVEEQCGKFDQLSTCIVKVLETCSAPTPANMAESLFRFVRNGTVCKDVANKSV